MLDPMISRRSAVYNWNPVSYSWTSQMKLERLASVLQGIFQMSKSGISWHLDKWFFKINVYKIFSGFPLGALQLAV